MEKIKQQLSDLVHNWTAIVMVTLFLFPVQPATALPAQTLVKTEAQLKQATLNRFSNEHYKTYEQLTDKELVVLLKAVGFSGSGLKKAWAIAKRESHGRPLAYNGNRNTGDSSYGIFQINMLGQLGIERKEKFNLTSNKQLFDPVTNAEITYHMSEGGTNWTAWKGLTPKAQEWLKQFPNSKS